MKIIISKNKGGSWNVHIGKRYQDQLSPCETLYTVALAITKGEIHSWLQPKEYWDEQRKRYAVKKVKAKK